MAASTGRVITRITDKGIVMEQFKGDSSVQSPTFIVEIPAQGSGNSYAVWAPYKAPAAGHFTQWADAVAAVQSSNGPTTIYIDADANCQSVQIPGGVWTLNNTTIVGTATGACGEEYRGEQTLLQVYTESDIDHPCRIYGVAGLKDLEFYGEDYCGSPHGCKAIMSAGEGDLVILARNDEGNLFSQVDVGRAIEISNAGAGDNNGCFYVHSVIDENTLTFRNCNYVPNDANNGHIHWGINRLAAVFYVADSYGTDNQFVLDNVQFHTGNCEENHETFYVKHCSKLFLKLVNGATTRWHSFKVEGFVIVQTDGSACQIRSDSFVGCGFVKFYPLAGTEFSPCQGVDYCPHQGIIYYTPDDGGNWSGSPYSVHGALDELASRVYSLENPS